MRRRSRRVAAAAIVAVAVSLSPATPASAEPAPVYSDTIVDSATIQKAAVRGDVLRAEAALGDEKVQGLRRRMSEYIQDRAAQGQFLDERQVFAAALDNPLLPGHPIQVAWAEGTVPRGIHLHKAEYGNVNTLMGYNLAALAGSADGERAGLRAAGGSSASTGFTGVGDHPNMYKEAPAQPCTTYWFTPEYTSAFDGSGNRISHQLVSCWEIWAQDATVHFEYNRWATWTIAPPSTDPLENRSKAWTQDFSILSRPWSGSTAISSLVDSTYPSGQSTCDNWGNVTIGGSYGGITGSITFPVYQCESTWRHFDTGLKQFGMDWDGYVQSTTRRQFRLDAAGRYNAINVTVLPVWADQTYVSTHSCRLNVFGTCSATSYDRGWKFQDSGW